MSDSLPSDQFPSGKADQLLEVVVAAFFRLLALLPLRVLHGLGVMLGQILWWSNTRNRQITEINLSLCFPELSASDRKKLARRSLIESAKTFLEIAVMWVWPAQKTLDLVTKISGEQYLQESSKNAKGLIILAPHLGNWEVVGLFHAQRGSFSALYAPAKIPALGRIMYKGRTQNGSVLAPTNASGVKSLLKALKAGKAIGILPDQVPEMEGGLFAPFFGEPALTMTLIVNLAARTGATVLCCYAKRLHDKPGFELCLRPAAVNIASENLQDAVNALNQSVEACVRDCPEQYQWEYKRFRKRPQGQPKLY